MATRAEFEQLLLSWIAADIGVDVSELRNHPAVGKAIHSAIPKEWTDLDQIDEVAWTQHLQQVFDAVYQAWSSQGSRSVSSPQVIATRTQTLNDTWEDPSDLSSSPSLSSSSRSRRSLFLVAGAQRPSKKRAESGSVEIIPLPEGFEFASRASSLASRPSGSHPLPQVGDVIDDKYRLERELGGGGFGVVFEAQDLALNHKVAIKFLHGERATRALSSAIALEQFRAEARLVAKLNHPNIVDWKVFTPKASGLDYFVMEYIEGEDLRQILRRETKLAPDRVAKLLLQILDALRSAHHLSDTDSVLHLDLKPGNVFITANSQGEEWVKVIDFGIGQYIGGTPLNSDLESVEDPPIQEDPQRPSTLRKPSDPSPSDPKEASGSRSQSQAGSSFQVSRACTPEYASPEQCAHMMGQEALAPLPLVPLDGRSDLYSLGVMGFQMLTGRFPFEKPTRRRDWLHTHLHETPLRVREVEPSIPRGLAAFIDQCLIRERKHRFNGSRDAYEALKKVVEPKSRVPLVLGSVMVLMILAFIFLRPPSPQPQTPSPRIPYVEDLLTSEQLLDDSKQWLPILPSSLDSYEQWQQDYRALVERESQYRQLVEDHGPKDEAKAQDIDLTKLDSLLSNLIKLHDKAPELEQRLLKARESRDRLDAEESAWNKAIGRHRIQ